MRAPRACRYERGAKRRCVLSPMRRHWPLKVPVCERHGNAGPCDVGRWRQRKCM